MRNCLVTGGAGFLGSHLVEALLRRGDRVQVLDNLSTGSFANLPSGVQLIFGDVADRELVGELLAGADLCFHLAAVASVAKSYGALARTHRVNLGSFVGVIEGIVRAERPIPLIYASSAAVYGRHEVAVREDAGCVPTSPYGADKLGCELHARVAGQAWHIPSFGLRFFNLYGPRQDAGSPYSGVIARFLDAVARREPLTILGEGTQVRDFVFVADAVDALLRAAERAEPGAPVANICTGSGTSVLGLAQAVRQATGTEIRFAPPRPGDVPFSVGNPERAARLLDWRPRMPLADGLRRTMASAGDDRVGDEGVVPPALRRSRVALASGAVTG